ncbi:FAD-dependent oxidoreductase [Paenibacillus allorhizosphaerae]|uniref:Epoxidase LasC n=1 Tax=Paenibacillus allorhizosphaerae TaxID=2849866 RepID=A0ABN7TS96_9BACL|nr:FAD dependent oxidoreductase [Paenibacillus allorhizosphaerae]CAG7653844.1 Putative epoxidase LasC [Paenibacillus allorhizosphaerae]
MNNERKEGKALVIGGSIAGLLTARVLSDYYEEVLIIDKDDFPDKPEDRAGTPHGFHPHRFTQRGKQITERLFPGYENDLLTLGAPTSLNKTVHNMNAYGSFVGQYQRNDIKFSRAALEWVLRQRAKRISHVRFLPNHDVIELVTNPDRTAVTGVRVRERGKAELTLAGDMVVDTSGRHSRLPKWLAELGYDVPSPDMLKVDLGYSTRRYKVPAHLLHMTDTWDVINIAGQPAKGTYTGVFSFIENRIAEMLLYRPGGHFPPTDAEAFEQAVAGLPSPIIADILQQLEPIGSPRGFRVSELYRHRYERMSRWPSGLLVLGDAFCIYDPIFGQGMTVAAMEAEVLESCLQERGHAPKDGFEQRVLQKMQDAIGPAWWLNCANDLQWEGVQYAGSEPLKGIGFGRKYMDLYLKHATTEQSWELYGLYWAVNTLSVSPDKILNPQMAATVLAATDEGRTLLAELSWQYGPSWENEWDRIVPSFTGVSYESVR